MELLKRRSGIPKSVLGMAGRSAGSQVAVIDGLPADVPEDSLKALARLLGEDRERSAKVLFACWSG